MLRTFPPPVLHVKIGEGDTTSMTRILLEEHQCSRGCLPPAAHRLQVLHPRTVCGPLHRLHLRHPPPNQPRRVRRACMLLDTQGSLLQRLLLHVLGRSGSVRLKQATAPPPPCLAGRGLGGGGGDGNVRLQIKKINDLGLDSPQNAQFLQKK